MTSGAHGRAVSDFVKEAQERISSEVSLPKGTYLMFAGAEQARTQSQQDLLNYTLAANVGIVLLLFLALKSNPGHCFSYWSTCLLPWLVGC